MGVTTGTKYNILGVVLVTIGFVVFFSGLAPRPGTGPAFPSTPEGYADAVSHAGVRRGLVVDVSYKTERGVDGMVEVEVESKAVRGVILSSPLSGINPTCHDSDCVFLLSSVATTHDVVAEVEVEGRRKWMTEVCTAQKAPPVAALVVEGKDASGVASWFPQKACGTPTLILHVGAPAGKKDRPEVDGWRVVWSSIYSPEEPHGWYVMEPTAPVDRPVKTAKPVANPSPPSQGKKGGKGKEKPGKYKHLYDTLVFWANDFHISPTMDVTQLFAEWGVTVIEKSLSGHCHLTHSCASDLKVLNKQNGMNLVGGDRLKASFFEAYKADPVMENVDAFLCFHPSSMCELFMPFNKSLIVAPSTRFELGREAPPAWSAWVENVRRIAKSPRNAVISNNRYDSEYVKYFTGLKDVPVLPSFCNYTGAHYNPHPETHPAFLSGKILQGAEMVAKELGEANARAGKSIQVLDVRKVYPGKYEYSDLAQHPGMVYPAPYQLSTMSIFEQYRMDIPMFFPSVEFLVDLDLEAGVVNQRTFKRVYTGQKKGASDIGPHPEFDGPKYDPNDELSREAMLHWFAFGDFYEWPHIVHYDSWDDLLVKLEETDLDAVSRAMAEYNAQVLDELRNDWMRIFDRIIEGRGGGAGKAGIPQGSYAEAMADLWS